VIVAHDGIVLAEVSDYLGVATNNVAEYKALILTLSRAADLGCRRIDVKMDSELVVKQLHGSYRVKDEKIKPLHAAALRQLERFDDHSIAHVRREENKAADKLVNAVLDAREKAAEERRQ
jgi:ribonuclease HI